MNSVCKEIFRAIHEGKWLKIEDRNKSGEITNYWIGIKDIEVALARIAVYVEENDFTEAYAETASLIDYVAHYLDDFRVSTENIF